MAEKKTNAMRVLDRAHVKYESLYYECAEFTDAVAVSERLGISPELTYKTLIVRGRSDRYYAAVVPCIKEVDLKKIAKVIGEKSVELIHVNEINKVTGYVRGGCSPLGIKRRCDIVLDVSSVDHDEIYISGGKLGCSLRLNPEDLIKVSSAIVDNIVQ